MCESNGVENMSSVGMHQNQNGTLESFEEDFSIINTPVNGELVNGDLVNLGDENIPNNGLNLVDETTLPSILMSATPDVSIEKLQSIISDVVKENASLKAVVTKNSRLMNNQLTSVQEWHNQMTTQQAEMKLKLEEAQEEISRLRKENSELLDMNKKIENKLKKDVSPVSDEDNGFEIVTQKETDVANADCESKILIPKFVHEAEIKELAKEIENLNIILVRKEKELKDESLCHTETKKMLATVQTNYDRVTKLLQIQSKDEKEKEFVDVEREMDTKMYLEKIDNLTAKLMHMEEKMQEDEGIINSLKTELEKMTKEAEIIPILKSQVEEFKAELDCVTLARDAAQEEVLRMTKELHETISLCSICKQEATNVVDGNSSQQGATSVVEENSINREHKSLSPKSRKLELKQKGKLYFCPLCPTTCTSLIGAENHVNNCLDKQERPKRH